MSLAARPGRVRSDAGVALVVVLLLLALLLTIVAEFAQAMRLEAVTATNFRSSLSETWLAEAGYQRALAEILPEALAHELDADGALLFRRARLGIPTVPERLDLRIDPGRFSYRITDESARLNLNRATRDVLDRLLQEAGVEKTERDVIVDSIQDWRDPNEEHRLNGAESDYYLGLPVPYRSKNADFDSVDELLQVKGVTRGAPLRPPRRAGPGRAPHRLRHERGQREHREPRRAAGPRLRPRRGGGPDRAPPVCRSRRASRRGSGATIRRSAPTRSASRPGRAARRPPAASSRRSSSARRGHGTGPGGASRLALVGGAAAAHGARDQRRHGPKPSGKAGR